MQNIAVKLLTLLYTLSDFAIVEEKDMQKFQSIRTKLIRHSMGFVAVSFVAILLVIMVVGSVTVAVNAQRSSKYIENIILTKGETLVLNNSNALEIMVLENAFTAVEELVTSTVQRDSSILYGVFMDSSRVSWNSTDFLSGTSDAGDTLRDSMSLWASNLRINDYKRSSVRDISFVEFVSPVKHKGVVLGHIRYGISTADMDRAIAETIRQGRVTRFYTILGLTLLGILLVALRYLVIARFAKDITRPIDSLIESSNLIIKGEYEEEVPILSSDEIGNLARKFDKLRKTVKLYTEDLRASNIKLEQKVEARTYQVEVARQEAERANEAKSQFLANMSHEIRTPMNSILGFTQVLLEESKDDLSREYLETIYSSGQSLLRLINDILDFSKIEAGKLELSLISFSPRLFFEEIEKLFALRVRDIGIELKIDVASSVPDFLIADDVRLKQIYVNLIGNSCKFTEVGGIYLTVSYENDELVVLLRDTGIGIPKDKQESIFTPFVQADGTVTRKYGGTGLGLVVTSRLIEMMKGSIDLISEEGLGTTFTIKIPLPVGIESEEYEKKQTTAIPLIREKRRIAIIEDVPQERMLLSDILNSHDYRVLEIDDDGDVIEDLVKHEIELVLVDLNMKHRSGFDINEMIKSDIRTAHLPVLVCSGDERAEQSVYCGMLDYVTKPVDEHQLLSRIQSLLRASNEFHTIFVLDDDETLLKLYSNYLRRAGYATFAFKHAEEAIELVDKGIRPDFVILDLMMPDIDGFTFLDILHAKGITLPTLIVSAKDLSEGDVHRITEDTLGYIQKGDKTVAQFIHTIDTYFKGLDAKGIKMLSLWRSRNSHEPDLLELLDEAVENVCNLTQELEHALTSGDLELVLAHAHSIKGVSLNFRMEEVSTITEEILSLGASEKSVSTAIEALVLELKEDFSCIRYLCKNNTLKLSAVVDEEQGLRVLVAEDIKANQMLIKTYLKPRECVVDIADNGLIAIEMLNENEYDILFLDMQMPELDGRGVLQRLKTSPMKHEQMVVVALTADAIKGAESSYLEAGCDYYLSKPIAKADIFTLLDTIEARKKEENGR